MNGKGEGDGLYSGVLAGQGRGRAVHWRWLGCQLQHRCRGKDCELVWMRAR